MKGAPMQTRIGQVPAMAGGLAVLSSLAGGVAMWQLGIEFERAWMRSYCGPLLDESPTGEFPQPPRDTRAEHQAPAATQRRRWVAGHHPRLAPRPAYMAWPRRRG